jgi:predicted nucleic acid binding AN1-type Zn finger protein
MFCKRHEEPKQIDCKGEKEWTNVHLGCEHD